MDVSTRLERYGWPLIRYLGTGLNPEVVLGRHLEPLKKLTRNLWCISRDILLPRLRSRRSDPTWRRFWVGVGSSRLRPETLIFLFQRRANTPTRLIITRWVRVHRPERADLQARWVGLAFAGPDLHLPKLGV